jgi:RIO kinase 1
MITLDKEITKIGGWSTIYTIKDDCYRCAKVLAPHRRYKGAFPDPAMIAQKKYGIEDMLQYELDNYHDLMAHVPDELKSNFVTIEGLETTACGRKALVMELVTDDTGGVAKNLDANTRPLSLTFFKTLEHIRRDVLLRHAIDHFGIACRNILVRNQDCPVLIDFQNSAKRHRGQFWLALPFFIRRKITRKFQRVYRDIKMPDFTKSLGIEDMFLP